MECSSAVKENLKNIREKLLFAAIWIDLENIIVSKVSQRKTNIV